MKSKPNHSRAASAFTRYGVSLVALMTAGMVPTAFAQDAEPAAAEEEETVVVVTGFRNSLQSSISEKKRSNDMIDVIKSEDIGQFPDLNLAESLQRIPGVAIDRDGGEGRQITVRGLNSEFSRTRLNGLEVLATTGGKDASGGTNRGRGFDFNIFAADLFNSLTVRKSLSAEIEEGSLGATVDLQTARPFDYKGFTMAASGQVGYNDLSKSASPRGTFMISNRWADGKLGALISVAYGEREVVEESNNTTRWENAYGAGNAGRFGAYSTDGGATFTPITPCTPSNRQCNVNQTHANNPVLTDPEAARVVEALHPRIPRYNRFTTDQERFGMTAAFQMRPNPDTLISLDGLYATYGANRQEYEIEAISFSRNGAGNPLTEIYDYTIDDQGTITKASFNNVDIRSEHRFDELETTFHQLNLTWDQNWSSKFSSKLLIGASKSSQVNPEQTTFSFESYDVQGYSYDYTNMTQPVFNYGESSTGCTPDQACYWTYSTSAAQGDRSLIRLRPQFVDNKFSTVSANFKYDFSENLTIKFGGSVKTFDYTTSELGRYTSAPQTRDENASGAIATEIDGDIAKYSQTVTVAGNTYLIPNLDLIRSTFDYNCRCTNAFGVFTMNSTNSNSRANTRDATEDDTAFYIQADFSGTLASMPFRGNIGVREVETSLTTTGYLGRGTESVLTTIERSYKDTLPALNLMIEPFDNLYVRFAAAKTMSRPSLASLSPGGSITTSTQTISQGNPYLDPVRANTLDLSFEWYPDKDTLFSVAFFQKDIKSYIQNRVRELPFSELGLGEDILDGSGLTPSDTFRVTQPINSPGGKLKGYEISLQRPFTFLPGFLSRTGGIINYTFVESQIDYITASTPTSVTLRRENLLGLSPKSMNVTLYYEGEKLSGRVAMSKRDGYISQLLPGSSADFWGKNGTTNFDAQIAYQMNDNFSFVFEAINMTNEADDRYIAYDTVQGNTASDLNYDYSETGRQFYLGVRYKY